ncbi:MAG TPA: hypothetical protein EYO84_04425 [Planctomycetes bacterium]|nr:hypothetical protein [Planctomycetota bacterium]
MPQLIRTADLPGDAARTLLDLVSCHGNGTWQWKPADADSPQLLVQIEDDRLVDLHRPEHPSVLIRALIDGDSLRAKDRKQLEKQAAEQQTCPGVLCLDAGLFDTNNAAEAIGQVVDGDLMLVLEAGASLWSGPHPQPISSGLLGRVDLGQSLEEAFLRSARRHGLWKSVIDLPLLRDVVAATPQAMRVIQDPDEAAETKALLEASDGLHDIAEIAGARPDRWHALDHLLKLVALGHIETQNAMELFRAGETFFADGQSHQALRRWRRAEEMGLDDFDLGARIGTTCAETGRTAEAQRRLRAHAQRCSDQLRIDAARDAWSNIAIIDPEDPEARKRAIALWQKEPGDDPALCLQLARTLIDVQQADSACQLLDSVGAMIPDPRIHEMHEEAACSAGDPHGSHKARWRRAESLRACGQLEQAAAHYEYLSRQEQPEPLLSLRLTEVAMHRGDTNSARQCCQQALVGPQGDPRILDAETKEALEFLAQAAGAPSDVHRWIADNARRIGDVEREATARHQQCLSHQQEADLVAACEAARRSQLLQPENLEVALQRAHLEEQIGDIRTAISTLEQTLDQLPGGHPREQELIEALLQRDRSSRIALERSVPLTKKGSVQQRSILLRLSLLSVLEGQRCTVSDKPDANQLVGAILSALIDPEENRLSQLEEIVQQLDQQSDPLVQLLREEFCEVDPEHPFLKTTATASAVTEFRRVEVVRTGLGGITEKLRNVQVSDSSPPAQTAANLPEEITPDGGTEETQKGIQTALERLRSLRTVGTDEGKDDPTPDTGSCSPQQANGDLGDAAARLGDLREDQDQP